MELNVNQAAVAVPAKKERIFFWDNLKGILIMLVVLCHMIISYGTSNRVEHNAVKYLLSYLETFVMPTFVFCAGYLSKSTKARSSLAYVKLFVLYLIFNGIMSVYMHFETGAAFHLIKPSVTYWYLLSMILWRWSVGYVSKIKWSVPFSILIALLIGYWGEIDNTFSLVRTIGFYPYFLIGFLFDKDKFMKFLNKKYRTVIGTVAFAALSVGVYKLMKVHFLTSHQWQYYAYQNNYQDLLDRILLIGLALVLGTVFMMAIPNKKLPLISQWGRNSLGIYVCHRVFTRLFLLYFPASEFTRMYYLYIAIVTLLLCLIFGTNAVSKAVNTITDKTAQLIMDVNETPRQTKSVLVAIVVILIISLGVLKKLL